MEKEVVKTKNKDNNSTIYIVIVLLFIFTLVNVFENYTLKQDVNKLTETVNKNASKLGIVYQIFGIPEDFNPNAVQHGYETKEFKEIKGTDIKNESKDETIMFWIGSQNCGHCQNYAPEMEKAQKDLGIQARYINIDKMFDGNTLVDEESWNAIISLTGKGEWKTFAKDNMGGTPLTIIVKNNKVIGGLSGAADADTIKQVYKKALGK